MACTARRNRWRDFKERFEVLLYGIFKKQRSNWSELPNDIFECVIERLCWTDRIRIRAVCKGWSVPNRHIPTIDKVPWALKRFCPNPTNKGHILGECRLLDPVSQLYGSEKECPFLFGATPCASVYGWVLFRDLLSPSYFLFSPFTIEVINLPELGELDLSQAAAFSLNATSPKCIIFLLYADNLKICVNICSPGDYSWKTFEFNDGLDQHNSVVDAIYGNGVLYGLFSEGQLGAFNLELEEWTVLANQPLLPNIFPLQGSLITSGADLLMLDWRDLESLKLYKFDFLEMCWRYQNNLNNYSLFICRTCFSAPAVGETSALANTIFYADWSRQFVKHYGSSSSSPIESSIYRRCVEATEFAEAWIEVPSGGIWRANDLINAV